MDIGSEFCARGSFLCKGFTSIESLFDVCVWRLVQTLIVFPIRHISRTDDSHCRFTISGV